MSAEDSPRPSSTYMGTVHPGQNCLGLSGGIVQRREQCEAVAGSKAGWN
jgi:hypothetical protein